MILAANLQTRYCPSCGGYISQFCLFLRKAAGPGWADDWFYGRLWSLMGKSAHHRRNEGWRSFVAGTPRLSVPIAGFLSSSNFLQHFLISLEVKVVLPFWGKPFWCFESIHPAIFTFHFLFVEIGQVGIIQKGTNMADIDKVGPPKRKKILKIVEKDCQMVH